MTKQAPVWDQFALLLVDIQEDFWPVHLQEQFPDLPNNVMRMLDKCRLLGIQVIHVHALFSPDGHDWMARYRLSGRIPCIEGTGGEIVLPFARPRNGEVVIKKQSFDAFIQTDIDSILRENGKRFLLTAGIQTSVCVLTTTLSATQRGYLCAVVGDCCADNLEKHNQVLSGYGFGFETTDSSNFENRHAAWMDQLSAMDQLQR